MDFKGFKKIDADKHYTTFQHPDGHIIKVSHKGIDHSTRQEMRGLKMARGGSVPHYYEGGGPAPVKQPGIGDIFAELGKHISLPESEAPRQHTLSKGEPVFQADVSTPALQEPLPGAQLASLSPAGEQAPAAPSVGGTGNYQLPQAAAPMPGMEDPYGTKAYEDTLLKGLGQQESGIRAQAAAQTQLGNQQAKAHADAASHLGNLQTHYNNQLQQLDQEREHLLGDIEEGHIDPRRLWGQASTPNKVGTAISILLSGIGAGITGQENMAMKFLNQEIDRDIEAQKTNLSKTQSLLSANQQQYGNLRDAQAATKATLMDLAAAQIGKAAAKAQGPLAQAQAQQAIGKLNQDSASLRSQLAARKALMSGGGAGGGLAQANPALAIRFLVPEHDQKEATKELGESQEATKAVQATMKAFNDIKQLQTLGSRVGSPIQSSSQIDALKGPITAQLSKATAGRFTETDAHFLDKLWPSLADNADTVNKKMQAMQRLLDEKFNFPTLQKYGLSPKFPKMATPIANVPAKFGK